MTIEFNDPKIEEIFINEFKSDMKKFSQFISILLKKNPKVNDEFESDIASLGGSLHHYADASKIKLEDKAWELHIKDKYQ